MWRRRVLKRPDGSVSYYTNHVFSASVYGVVVIVTITLTSLSQHHNYIMILGGEWLYRWCSEEESVPGLQIQKMSHCQYEQGWWVSTFYRFCRNVSFVNNWSGQSHAKNSLCKLSAHKSTCIPVYLCCLQLVYQPRTTWFFIISSVIFLQYTWLSFIPFKQIYIAPRVHMLDFIRFDCLVRSWLLNTNDQTAFDDKIYLPSIIQDIMAFNDSWKCA